MIQEYIEKHQLNHYFHTNRIYKAYDFLQFLRDLNLKLEYIKSGSTGHCFKAFNESYSCAIKVVAYSDQHKDKYGDIFNKERPENVEILILESLNKIENFEHITKLYGGFYTTINVFENMNIENKKIKEFKENIEMNKFDPICSILVSEYCKLGDLQSYIQRHKQHIDTMFFKVIFFQVLSSLVIIHDKCDTFKHNDLKCNNILLQESNPAFSHYQYNIGSVTFKVPNIGVFMKLWDFDFSTGPCSNLKVKQNWAKQLNINEDRNLYYDIHFFFNSLINVYPEILENEELSSFIDFVIPKMYRSIKKKKKTSYRLRFDHEYITPLYLIQVHHFFDEFKE